MEQFNSSKRSEEVERLQNVGRIAVGPEILRTLNVATHRRAKHDNGNAVSLSWWMDNDSFSINQDAGRILEVCLENSGAALDTIDLNGYAFQLFVVVEISGNLLAQLIQEPVIQRVAFSCRWIKPGVADGKVLGGGALPSRSILLDLHEINVGLRLELEARWIIEGESDEVRLQSAWEILLNVYVSVPVRLPR